MGLDSKLIGVKEALQLNGKEVKRLYKEYINPGRANLVTLGGMDKHFVRAEGVRVWDADGNEYIDFLGSFGALNLGHNPPQVLEALELVNKLPNFLQVSLETMASALAFNLAQLTPGDLKRSFFCNSGAEAVEGALKLARAAKKKERIIYCEGSFHGKTMGALSVTGREKYQKPFAPLVSGCEAVPYGDLTALEQKLSRKDVAAFIVEPIQGERGVLLPPEGYLQGARELCDRYDALLIVDEVQTGLGRTGYLFACEHEGIIPDIMCLAKSLGGSIAPIGAYITTEEVWDQAYAGLDKCLLHTSTFGGNTRAAAAAITALQIIVEQNLPHAAREKGNYFLTQLKELQEKYPMIREVRGRGLMIGMEFEKPAKGILDKLSGGTVNKLSEEYLASLLAGQLLNRHRIITAFTLNNPNVIRLAPPLIVEYHDIDRVIAAIDTIFSRNHGFMGIALAGTKTALGSLLKR